ncbi:hypothetical protein BLNAU_14886 [Blattamonas nauphoetae]|uniref:Uncharacterized protein n=1 Tax=Blattamonas nauphoetae TaxID=2049346 RepID=A0ABQ9XJ51_9EUKA|nr:hypothetical protein BLNAU_14886 [Blattamonas nauphoetae]
MSFEDMSRIYCSLVALVKADYTFDKALQDRASRFLKNIEQKLRNKDQADKLVTDFVHSSSGSPSGFVESISTLLTSPHSKVVNTALSFLFNVTASSTENRCRLVASDIVSNVLATVQPHTLPISGNESKFNDLIVIIITEHCISLALPFYLNLLGITTAVDQYNHHEMIFQKVVLPSSHFSIYLISNWLILNRNLMDSFMILLSTIFEIGPFHRPTLEYVVASPIVMGFSSCLSFVEMNGVLNNMFSFINDSLDEWKKEGPEVAQSGKRMMQALFSEGFEDTLEQMLTINKDGNSGRYIIDYCRSISQRLGSNVKRL